MDAEAQVGNKWEDASSIVDRQNVKSVKTGGYVNDYQMPSMGDMGGMMNMMNMGGGGGDMGSMSFKDMGMGFLNQFGTSWIQNYFRKKQQDDMMNQQEGMMSNLLMGGNSITGGGTNQYQKPTTKGETAKIGGGGINFPNNILGTILENDTLQKIYTDRNISDATQTSTDTLYYNTNTGNLELYDPINDTTVAVNVASKPNLPFKPDPTRHTQTTIKNLSEETETVSGSGWGEDGFESQESGDRFRAWMSETYPEWISKHKNTAGEEENLELIESPTNKYIKDAYEQHGKEYEEFAKLEKRTTGVMKNISVPGEELKSEYKTKTKTYDSDGNLVLDSGDEAETSVQYQLPVSMSMDPNYRNNQLSLSGKGIQNQRMQYDLDPDKGIQFKDLISDPTVTFRSPVKRGNQYQQPTSFDIGGTEMEFVNKQGNPISPAGSMVKGDIQKIFTDRSREGLTSSDTIYYNRPTGDISYYDPETNKKEMLYPGYSQERDIMKGGNWPTANKPYLGTISRQIGGLVNQYQGGDDIGGTGGGVTTSGYGDEGGGDEGGGGDGSPWWAFWKGDNLKKWAPYALGAGALYGGYRMFKDADNKSQDAVNFAKEQDPNLISDKITADIVKLPRISDKSLITEAQREALRQQDMISGLSVPEQVKYFAKKESSREGLENVRDIKGKEFQKNLQIG